MYINKISIFLLKIQQIYTEINNSVYRKIYQDKKRNKLAWNWLTNLKYNNTELYPYQPAMNLTYENENN